MTPTSTKSTIKSAPTTDEKNPKPAARAPASRTLGQSRGAGFDGGERGGFPDAKPPLPRCAQCGGPMSRGADEDVTRCGKCYPGTFTGGGFAPRQAVADGGSERSPVGRGK